MYEEYKVIRDTLYNRGNYLIKFACCTK